MAIPPSSHPSSNDQSLQNGTSTCDQTQAPHLADSSNRVGGVIELTSQTPLKQKDPHQEPPTAEQTQPMAVSEDHGRRSDDSSDAQFAPAETEAADLGDDQLEGAAGAEISVGTVAPQKKARKKKPKSQRGLWGKPTGFEEYFVEAPLTPEQYVEEKSLYDPSKSFRSRVQTALENYFKKRNLDSERKNVLDKYLTFGGIRGGQNMFSGGIDPNTQDATEIATMAAPHAVELDDDEEGWVVDFEGCLKGFLSSQLPFYFDLTIPDRIEKYVGVPKNFLNYLLYHNVCPEYRDQIESSRSICDQACQEFADIVRIQPLLPGNFNTACSEIFGGQYHGLHNAASEAWMSKQDKEQWTIGVSPEKARKIFKLGFAACATDAQMACYNIQAKENMLRTSCQMEVHLEITDMVLGRSTPETNALYQHETWSGELILGKLFASSWNHVATQEEDLAPGVEQLNPKEGTAFEFWIEDRVIDKLHVGMKIQATIHQLSFGIYHIDNVHAVRCSFYDILTNEMMLGWKPVEKEWLPPRSQADPGAQDGLEIGESAENGE